MVPPPLPPQKKFMGGLFYMGRLMIRSCQKGESFISAFSSNLKTVNLKISPNHGAIFT